MWPGWCITATNATPIPLAVMFWGERTAIDSELMLGDSHCAGGDGGGKVEVGCAVGDNGDGDVTCGGGGGDGGGEAATGKGRRGSALVMCGMGWAAGWTVFASVLVLVLRGRTAACT